MYEYWINGQKLCRELQAPPGVCPHWVYVEPQINLLTALSRGAVSLIVISDENYRERGNSYRTMPDSQLVKWRSSRPGVRYEKQRTASEAIFSHSKIPLCWRSYVRYCYRTYYRQSLIVLLPNVHHTNTNSSVPYRGVPGQADKSLVLKWKKMLTLRGALGPLSDLNKLLIKLNSSA